MNCQTLFSGKNKKNNYVKMLSADTVSQHAER